MLQPDKNLYGSCPYSNATRGNIDAKLTVL